MTLECSEVIFIEMKSPLVEGVDAARSFGDRHVFDKPRIRINLVFDGFEKPTRIGLEIIYPRVNPPSVLVLGVGFKFYEGLYPFADAC